MPQPFDPMCIDAFATHLPALLRVVACTSGPVVEFGCGMYSTITLHEVCKASARKLVSLETDHAWYSRFEYLAHDGTHHELLHADSYDAFWPNLHDMSPDVVFIDHGPGERRVVDLSKLRNSRSLIVVHDTECSSYGYEPLLTQFRYRYDYKRLAPWTTVVSDSRGLAGLNLENC